MSFLVLLLLVWIEKFSAWRLRLQQDGWWQAWLQRVEGEEPAANHTGWQLFCLILLPLFLLGLLLWGLESVAYGWLAFPVHLLVMLYSLGRGDLLAQQGPFRDAWRRGDQQGALHAAERDMGVTAEQGDELLARVQGHLLWQSCQGFFVVIFWYALLGPLVALAYRLLALTEQQAASPVLRERAGQWRHALDWLPVRLLISSFALVGNFVAVSRGYLAELLNWDIEGQRLVAEAGRTAAEVPAQASGEAGLRTLDALWHLLLRTAVVWYAALALWILLI